MTEDRSEAASVGRRIAAAALDGAVAVALAVALSPWLGAYCAGQAAVALAVGSPDTFWRGPVPLMLGVLGEFFYALPVTSLAVVLVEPLLGRTPGKQAVGLEIALADAGCAESRRDVSATAAPARSRPPRAARWQRALVKGAGLLLFAARLAVASSPLLVAGTVVAVGTLLAIVASVVIGRSAPHDRFVATRVVRSRSPRARVSTP